VRKNETDKKPNNYSDLLCAAEQSLLLILGNIRHSPYETLPNLESIMNTHSPKTLRACTYGLALCSIMGLSACNKASTPIPAATSTTAPTMPSAPVPSAPTVGASDVRAELGGSSEVPAVNGAATGTLEGRVDPATNIMKWTVKYSGLTGNATSAHFHGPAIAGENASPVVTVDGNLASPIVGVTTLTAAQLADVQSGKWYFNIHTTANPNGEIRGQLALKP
jgi:CHRD domain